MQLPLVRLVRHPRARRYVLRVTDQADVVVTVPRWGSASQARAFAEQHVDWIARERLRRMSMVAKRSWTPGTEIWLRGMRVPIVLEDGIARAGDVSTPESVDAGDLENALRAALRDAATRELPPRLLELADRAGLRVARVSVRNQRWRWGSCSSRGAIALNWRLLLMPPDVRDYVLWHELMHLKRGDHSPAFWKLVEQVCPDYRTARAWLRTHGPELA
ncbi:MAG: M48 family metallopeptidase [Acidobacteriota bacterium]|nr:M48 family metallopeptidase [Acidobacteriota bacterium]